MTFRQSEEILRQSMHRLLDRFEYLDEEDAEYETDTQEDSGHVRLFGIEQEDLEDCHGLMSDGFDTISLTVEERSDGTYTVTAHYSELPK